MTLGQQDHEQGRGQRSRSDDQGDDRARDRDARPGAGEELETCVVPISDQAGEDGPRAGEQGRSPASVLSVTRIAPAGFLAESQCSPNRQEMKRQKSVPEPKSRTIEETARPSGEISHPAIVAQAKTPARDHRAQTPIVASGIDRQPAATGRPSTRRQSKQERPSPSPRGRATSGRSRM